MIAIAAWQWNPAMAERFVLGRGDEAAIVPPLSITVHGAENLMLSTTSLISLAKAVALNMDPVPAKPEALLLGKTKPNPTAHLQWDSGRSIMIITPALSLSLDEARRVHKQLGELIVIAEDA